MADGHVPDSGEPLGHAAALTGNKSEDLMVGVPPSIGVRSPNVGAECPNQRSGCAAGFLLVHSLALIADAQEEGRRPWSAFVWPSSLFLVGRTFRIAAVDVMASRSFGFSWARKSSSFQTEELGIRSTEQKARAIPNNDAGGRIPYLDHISIKHGLVSRILGAMNGREAAFKSSRDIAERASTSDVDLDSRFWEWRKTPS